MMPEPVTTTATAKVMKAPEMVSYILKKARASKIVDFRTKEVLGERFRKLYDETMSELNTATDGNVELTKRAEELADILFYWLADDVEGGSSVSNEVAEEALKQSGAVQSLQEVKRGYFSLMVKNKLKDKHGLNCYQLSERDIAHFNPKASSPATSAVMKPILTLEALESELEERGITLEWDVIQHRKLSNQEDVDDALTRIHSDLRQKYTGVGFDVIHAYSLSIAKKTPVNRPLDAIRSVQWDGHSRIGDVMELYGFGGENLATILFNKWLYQAVALLQNDGSKAPAGMIVLQGSQGTGKSSLARWLALDDQRLYIDIRKFDPDNRDQVKRCTGRWIAELSEIEQTMNGATQEALKSFITSESDSFRSPYARDDETYSRRTSLIGTCNSDRFLIDLTGSRRFWPIKVNPSEKGTAIYDTLREIDSLQFWAQVLHDYQELCNEFGNDTVFFHLNSDELDEVEKNNRAFEVQAKGEPEVTDILDMMNNLKEEGKPVILKKVTVTQWKTAHRSLDRYDSKTIASALRHMGYTSEHSKFGTMFYLPVMGTNAHD